MYPSKPLITFFSIFLSSSIYRFQLVQRLTPNWASSTDKSIKGRGEKKSLHSWMSVPLGVPLFNNFLIFSFPSKNFFLIPSELRQNFVNIFPSLAFQMEGMLKLRARSCLETDFLLFRSKTIPYFLSSSLSLTRPVSWLIYSRHFDHYSWREEEEESFLLIKTADDDTKITRANTSHIQNTIFLFLFPLHQPQSVSSSRIHPVSGVPTSKNMEEAGTILLLVRKGLFHTAKNKRKKKKKNDGKRGNEA